MANASFVGVDFGRAADLRPSLSRTAFACRGAGPADGFRRIVLADPASGVCKVLGDSASARALSDEAPWADCLLVEEHEHLAADVITGLLKDHLLAMWLPADSMSRATSPFARETATVLLRAKGRPICSPIGVRGRFVLVSLRAQFVETVASRAGLDRETALLGNAELHDPALEHLILALRAELLEGCPSGRSLGQTIGSALVLRALQLCGRWVSPHDTSLHRPPAQMHSVVEHIRTNLAEHNCLQSLAAVAQMSPRQFLRLFSQSFGTSPHQYILRQRVARAQQLLTETKQPVADIAYSVGFPNQAHFTTMFRKLAGLTPKAFRDARNRPTA
jgi:AraC-like DNA-binding protein